MENRYKYTDEKKAHLHTLDGKPLFGTSTAGSVIAKPLTWWAAGLAVAKFGWLYKGNKEKGFVKKEARLKEAKNFLDRIKDYIDDTGEKWLALLDEAYAAHSVKLDSTATEGTDLHAEIEKYVKWHMAGQKDSSVVFNDRIMPFISWANAKVKRFLWSELHCYSERLWTGGISDIGYEDIEGNYGIIDIKSGKEAYLPQFWQCAGYDIEISENGGFDANGNKIFELDKPITHYIIFPFGMKEPQAQYNYDVEGGRAAFEAEMFLYKKLNHTI